MDERRLETLLSQWQESGQGVTLQIRTGERVTGLVEGIVDDVAVLYQDGVFHFIALEEVVCADAVYD